LVLAGYDVRPFDSAAAALAAIETGFPGIVVSDVRMPHMSGIELFGALKDRDPDLPVILVTGHGDVAMAVDALRAGAWDFLTKPFDPDALVASVGRAMEKRALVLENRRLRALVEAPDDSPLIGNSPAILRLKATIETLAHADIDVLVEGETGTGKELIARTIHQKSARARGRFVSIACAAVPASAAGATLRGNHSAAEGRAVQAHNGTLFLDDIDQADSALQAELIQLIEEKMVLPIDGRTPHPVNLRIIACMGEGNDRESRIQPALFYRLAAVRLRVPPLRERPGDIPLLFVHMLDSAAVRLKRVRTPPVLSQSILRHLMEHDWPGNLHELGRFAERVLLGLEDGMMHEAQVTNLTERVDAFERNVIIDAVRASRGDVGKAIALLGLPRKTFYYKVNRHGLNLRAIREQHGKLKAL
jgi:two-component system C4-dicarboxylate transport response regulator DctD